ncbi:MAG: hypothetical protein H7A52_08905 [Akkermansiaceae bacterium]|nr:hypothetical protein [Akkermansiaceae bacterium]
MESIASDVSDAFPDVAGDVSHVGNVASDVSDAVPDVESLAPDVADAISHAGNVASDMGFPVSDIVFAKFKTAGPGPEEGNGTGNQRIKPEEGFSEAVGAVFPTQPC